MCMSREVYFDRYFIRQPNPCVAAYREKEQRLFALPASGKPALQSESPLFNPASRQTEVQGFAFTIEGGHAVHISCENKLRIEIKNGIRQKDVEELLGAVMAQIDAVAVSFPLTIRIGEQDLLGDDAMAAYFPHDRSINFYASKDGGLLVNSQIADRLQIDEPTAKLGDFLQVALLHECSHALQQTDVYDALIRNLADDLKAFRTDGFPESSPMTESLETLSHASAYLKDIRPFWGRPEAEYDDYAFASEIWADIASRVRMGFFNSQAAKTTPWPAFRAMLVVMEALPGNWKKQATHDGSERFALLQGRIQRAHHENFVSRAVRGVR